ncbi:MAG: tetratricopeptide repeat protein [Dokdonella sp.]|nr:tetratricopeptide repeat protein [Dokdonella sp.]
MPNSTPPPPDVAALLTQGARARDEGRLADAEATLRAAIGLAPRVANAHDSLGLVLAALGRPAEAEAAHRQAIALAPAAAGAYNNLAVLLRAQRRTDEALAACEQAIARDPSVAAFHLNRGEILRVLLRPRDAAAAYANALRIRPDFADAYFALGQLWYETDNLAGARFALGVYAWLDPGDRHGARALLAMIDRRRRRTRRSFPPVRPQPVRQPSRSSSNTCSRPCSIADTRCCARPSTLDREGAARTDTRPRLRHRPCRCGVPFDRAPTGQRRPFAGDDRARARAGSTMNWSSRSDIDTAARWRDRRPTGIVVAAGNLQYVRLRSTGVIPAMYRALEPGGIAAFTIRSDPGGRPTGCCPRGASRKIDRSTLARACGLRCRRTPRRRQAYRGRRPDRRGPFALRRPHPSATRPGPLSQARPDGLG